MEEPIELEGIISFTMILKICLTLGLGASVIVLPFMIVKYHSGLGIVDAVMLVVLVPVASALCVVFYGAAGYWTYRFFARRRQFQMHKISLAKK